MSEAAVEKPALTPEQRNAALEGLRQTLHTLWQFGGHALVGWRPTASGMEVLTVPKIRLFNAKGAPHRVFSGDRMMGNDTFQMVARAYGLQPIELRLAAPVGDGPDALAPAIVEQIFTSYAVIKYEHHAVMLLDIVGFSLHTPEEQASQLATLEFALNIAVQAAREQGFTIESSRSTTGDGFYVWNLAKGLQADVDLYVVMTLFLAYYSILRRRVAVPAAVPTIRTAISIGSHYSYHQPGRGMGRPTEYIVGDVTISVARMIGKIRGDQIVIGHFERPNDAGHTLSTAQFVQLVSERLAAIKDLKILGLPLQRCAFYLTGPKGKDGGFRPQKLSLKDKHGLTHYCYNAKINIFLEGEETIYCGLQHADLMKPPPAAKH